MSFLLPEEDSLLPQLDPLDPRLRTSRVGMLEGETSRADKPAGMGNADLPGSDRDWRNSQPFTPPKPRSRYDLAMEKVDQVLTERPTRTAPNFWQKLAAAGLGASAGFVNAGRRTHIDPTAAIQGVTGETGFQQRTADWKQRLETTGQQAQIEASKQAAARQAEADAVNLENKRADTRLKNYNATPDETSPVIVPYRGKLVNPDTQQTIADNPGVVPPLEPKGYEEVLLNPTKFSPDQIKAAEKERDIRHRDPAAKNPQNLQLEADALDTSDPVKAAKAQAILKADEERKARITRAGAQGRVDVQVNAGGLNADDYARAGEQYGRTGQMPPMGRDSATRARIEHAKNQWARDNGFKPADLMVIQAAYRGDTKSLEKFKAQRDQIVSFENTAKANLDLFLNEATRLPDSGVPWVNTPIRLLDEKLVGAKYLPAINAARQVANNEIAKVTGGGGMSAVLSDSARHEVRDYNPKDATFAQIVEIARVLKADMANRHASMDGTIADISTRIGSGGNPQGSANPNQSGGTVIKWGRDSQGNPVRLSQ